MSLYTRGGLARQASLRGLTKSTASRALGLGAIAASAQATFDIFLSHSYLDSDEIQVIKEDIERIGHSVYVDWIVDVSLDRSRVTKETASQLRARMRQCRSLFYVTSASAPNSKWMPWELGYSDAQHGKVATLPVLDSEVDTDRYVGQEYLGLYPYVTKGLNRGGAEMLWIRESEQRYVTFEAWIHGATPQDR